MNEPQPYHLLDVFTDAPFSGNQLAVFPNGGTLDPSVMARLANELNIAESVFLTRLSEQDDRPARLRIFTPGREVPFAGHPTIGTAIALVDLLHWVGAERTQFVLEEVVGDVAVRVERDASRTKAWLTTPPISLGPVLDGDACAAMLNVKPDDLEPRFAPRTASAGSPFLYVGVRDAMAVDSAQLDAKALLTLIGAPDAIVGVMVFCVREAGTYVRMFAPMSGIAEDPATGSAAGPLYACLVEAGLIPKEAAEYRSEQGTKMGRRSTLFIRLVQAASALQYEVGGFAVSVGRGELYVPAR